MGLTTLSKGLEKPCVREEVGMEKEQREPLCQVEASLDRPDIQYAVKEICRDMSAPKVHSWAKLKRLARYLLEFTRLE